MADIERYLNRVEIQHRLRPKFIALATDLLERLDSAHDIMKAVPSLYNVNTAVGEQLDKIGEMIGIIRKDIPELVPGITPADIEDDELFRTIILSKIAQDNWDGTNEGLNEIWETTAARSFEIELKDNQNMSIDVTIMGDVDDAVATLLDNEYIVPKPMGVSIDTFIHVDNDFELTKIYSGVALYGVGTNYLGTTTQPDLTDLNPLYDETNALLLDENGTFLEG